MNALEMFHIKKLKQFNLINNQNNNKTIYKGINLFVQLIV